MTARQERSVALVTLGCTRNEVDSEELAGRLAADGWVLVDDAADADVAVVNTCGFVEQAKKDSIDTLLEAADLKEHGRTKAVVAVGCLAERYGRTLAEELPDADAVLGFDSYADLSGHLTRILQGERPASHVPRDRRRLLPLTPAARQGGASGVALPGHGTVGAATSAPSDLQPGGRPGGASGGPFALPDAAPTHDGERAGGMRRPASGPPVVRRRLDDSPWAPLKIASGCDRRCAFCAIPMFRGAFVSRPPDDVLAEARWLAERGVRELFLVSENSTSYGKDFGDLTLLEALLPELAGVDGVDRVRVSYLQPAEVRPSLLSVMATTPGVVPWFDISFQHAAPNLLRRMRRFGGTAPFLDLLRRVRDLAPTAGIRSNVIVGFPGETEADVEELERFLVSARLDVVGVFGYSDEDGTEGEGLAHKVPPAVVAERVARLQDLVEEITAERAEERIGEPVDVLLEAVDPDTGATVGRAAHQGPDIDGVTVVQGPGGIAYPLRPGEIVHGVVVASEGVDLVCEAPVDPLPAGQP